MRDQRQRIVIGIIADMVPCFISAFFILKMHVYCYFVKLWNWLHFLLYVRPLESLIYMQTVFCIEILPCGNPFSTTLKDRYVFSNFLVSESGNVLSKHDMHLRSFFTCISSLWFWACTSCEWRWGSYRIAASPSIINHNCCFRPLTTKLTNKVYLSIVSVVGKLFLYRLASNQVIVVFWID